MSELLADATREFRKHKGWADKALSELPDEAYFRRPAEQVNPVALIVKHLAGNLLSRWTDFLTTDGEKPTRDRDNEFVLTPADTRESLTAAWERGWQTLFDTLGTLTDADLGQTVLIRGEPHSVWLAVLRGLNHAAYHTGQILYLARMFNPGGMWLTVAPGTSKQIWHGARKPS
jgi:uncharacterized damage-inducible protein DinB